MRILLKDIKDERTELHGVLDQKECEARLDSEGEIYCLESAPAFKGDIWRSSGSVFLEGEMEAEIRTDCSRCLESFVFQVSHKLNYSLKPKGSEVSDREEIFEDLNLGYYSGIAIELGPILEDQLMLSLPMGAVCQSDCQGLCQSCGINLNQSKCSCLSVVEEKTDKIRPFAALSGLKVSENGKIIS